MHCNFDTNHRVPRWTFMDPCKAEAEPGAREESASSAWLALLAMNARDKNKSVICKGCTLDIDRHYRKRHSHSTQGKMHNKTWFEPLTENCSTSSTRQRKQVRQKSKIRKKWCRCNYHTNNRVPWWTCMKNCKQKVGSSVQDKCYAGRWDLNCLNTFAPNLFMWRSIIMTLVKHRVPHFSICAISSI